MSTGLHKLPNFVEPYITQAGGALVSGRKYRLTLGQTYTLPASPVNGDCLTVRGGAGAGVASINPAGAATLVGLTTLTIAADEEADLVYQGTNWERIQRISASEITAPDKTTFLVPAYLNSGAVGTAVTITVDGSAGNDATTTPLSGGKFKSLDAAVRFVNTLVSMGEVTIVVTAGTGVVLSSAVTLSYSRVVLKSSGAALTVGGNFRFTAEGVYLTLSGISFTGDLSCSGCFVTAQTNLNANTLLFLACQVVGSGVFTTAGNLTVRNASNVAVSAVNASGSIFVVDNSSLTTSGDAIGTTGVTVGHSFMTVGGTMVAGNGTTNGVYVNRGSITISGALTANGGSVGAGVYVEWLSFFVVLGDVGATGTTGVLASTKSTVFFGGTNLTMVSTTTTQAVAAHIDSSIIVAASVQNMTVAPANAAIVSNSASSILVGAATINGSPIYSPARGNAPTTAFQMAYIL